MPSAATGYGFSNCGNSSVGRARPCQGRGREFESRFPLQFSSLGKPEVFCFGAVAEWSCSGLQLRVRRFDSDPRLHFYSFYSTFYNRYSLTSVLAATIPRQTFYSLSVSLSDFSVDFDRSGGLINR